MIFVLEAQIFAQSVSILRDRSSWLARATIEDGESPSQGSIKQMKASPRITVTGPLEGAAENV
jgi:hypothetical protein